MNQLNKLWVIGDSFSASNYCVDIQHSFYGLMASSLSISTVHNLSRIGNSWDSIKQLLVGIKDRIDNKRDMILIGIPPLERITVFDDFQGTDYQGQIISTKDWSWQAQSEPSHQSLVSLSNFGEDQQLIVHSERSWTEIQTMRDIFFITQWLDSQGVEYLIVNLSKPFDDSSQWSTGSAMIDYVKQHLRCIVFKDTYYSINFNIVPPADFKKFGWYGHHGPEGNQRFWEHSIKPTLDKIHAC